MNYFRDFYHFWVDHYQTLCDGHFCGPGRVGGDTFDFQIAENPGRGHHVENFRICSFWRIHVIFVCNWYVIVILSDLFYVLLSDFVGDAIFHVTSGRGIGIGGARVTVSFAAIDCAQTCPRNRKIFAHVSYHVSGEPCLNFVISFMSIKLQSLTISEMRGKTPPT